MKTIILFLSVILLSLELNAQENGTFTTGNINANGYVSVTKNTLA